MASKLAPSNPADVMVVRDLTPNVVTLSVPFSRFASLKVGGRATLVKLTSGSLLVFSPVALIDEVKAKVASMGGKLAYIVAPDMEHHLFVSEWKAFYPAARILGPAGLPEKRAGQKSDKVNPKDEFSYVFEAKTKHSISISPEFDADFDVEFVDGHLNKEVVLFYKPDRVVIEADLLFNLPAKEQYSRVPEEERESPSLAGRIFSSFQTTEGDLKWARRFHWHLAAKDRESFNKSIKRIADWDFVTMVPCHGDTMEGDAKERFLRVFEWHLAGQKGGAKK